MISEIVLNLEQEDFLKEHGFHIVYGEPYMYVSGKLGREVLEFYNMESVEKIINEINQGKYSPNISTADSDITTSDLWEVDRSVISGMKWCGDIKLKVVKKYVWAKKARLVLEETPDCYVFVDRNVEGKQVANRVYKTIEFAEKAAIPHIVKEISLLETHMGKLKYTLLSIEGTQ